MFYVEITNGQITCKGTGDYKTEDQIEVSEQIYNDLTSIPAEYVIEDDEIVSVTPLPVVYPTPEPTLEEINRADIDYLAIMMGVEL